MKGIGIGVRQAKAMVRPEHAVGSDGLSILHWEGGDFSWGPLRGSGAVTQFRQQQICTRVSFILLEAGPVGRQ